MLLKENGAAAKAAAMRNGWTDPGPGGRRTEGAVTGDPGPGSSRFGYGVICVFRVLESLAGLVSPSAVTVAVQVTLPG